MRLHTRIYVHSLLVLLTVGAATTLVFALVGRGGHAREIGDRLVRHVAQVVADDLDDPRALDRRVRELHETLGVDLTVRDVGGRTLAAAGAAVPATPDALGAARRGALRTSVGLAPYAVAPLRAPGSNRVMGTLEMSVQRHFGPPALGRPLLFVVVVLVAAALVTRPVAGRLSRPLDRLTQAARRLGGGDLSARVSDLGTTRRPPAEIAELAAAFNDMASRLDRLVRGQKELLANVSHELRSPLARIRLALALLPQEGEVGARVNEVERDLGDVERLVDDVLQTARLDATGLPARLDTVDVGALLAEVAENARHDPALAGRLVEVETPSALVLVADAGLLRRALSNLVDNAAKYGAPPIRLAATRDGSRIALSVTDDGPGIPAEHRARVFDPFYRLDPARTPGAPGPRGYGLGLAFVRRVAEVHGGAVTVGPATVTDGGERGCRVVIALPLDAGGGGGT